jgi:hypothetical protein
MRETYGTSKKPDESKRERLASQGADKPTNRKLIEEELN